MADEEQQPTEEELLEQLQEELKKVKVADVLVQTVFTVSSLGYRSLGEECGERSSNLFLLILVRRRQARRETIHDQLRRSSVGASTRKRAKTVSKSPFRGGIARLCYANTLGAAHSSTQTAISTCLGALGSCGLDFTRGRTGSGHRVIVRLIGL